MPDHHCNTKSAPHFLENGQKREIETMQRAQKYQQEVQKFGGEQIGRRRRDDYTDGTVRIPVNSPSP